jgi:hypothetical protein
MSRHRCLDDGGSGLQEEIMKSKRMSSSSFAFLLLTGTIVVAAIGAIWNATRVGAFGSHQDSGHSLYRSVTRTSPPVQPAIEDLATVSRRASELSAALPLALPSQRFDETESDLIHPSAQERLHGLILPSSKGRSLSSPKDMVPKTLMTPSPPPDRQF